MGDRQFVRTRNRALDVARGVAMLIVVLGHALQGANGGDAGNPLHQFILSFQMELFFAISGFSVVWARERPFADAVKRQLLRLGVPYLAWVWLFYLAEAVWGIKTWTAQDAFGCLIFSGFWFLRQLLFINISYNVYSHVKGLKGVSLAIVTIGLFSFIPGQGGLLHHAEWFAIGFLSHVLWNRFLPEKTIELTSTSFAVRGMAWCGRNSLALYAVHWNLFFVFLSLQLFDFHSLVTGGFNYYVVVVLLFAVYLLGSVVVIKVLEGMPVVSRLFLGVDGREKRGRQ